MATRRFNVPPGWPVADGWEPPPGWQPDPTWPHAPMDWQFWTTVEEGGPGQQAPQSAAPPTFVPKVPAFQPEAPAFRPEAPPQPVQPVAGFGAAPQAGWPQAAGAQAGWPQAAAYPTSPPRTGKSTIADRLPPTAQTAISAALLVPTIALYFFAFREFNFWPAWLAILALEVYFLVVVAVWARSPQRRIAAVLLVLAGLGIDRGQVLLFELTHVFDSESSWPFRVSYSISMLLFVTAWCVARRRTWLSAGGVVVAAGLLVLADWLYYSASFAFDWYHFWLIDFGVLVGGCLAAWALDAMRGSRPAAHQEPLRY